MAGWASGDNQSGRLESNQRSPGPKPGAVPFHYDPNGSGVINVIGVARCVNTITKVLHKFVSPATTLTTHNTCDYNCA
jgi:hypothetical protein